MRLYSDWGYLLAKCDTESALEPNCGLGGGGGGGSFIKATRRGAARGMVAEWGEEVASPP